MKVLAVDHVTRYRYDAPVRAVVQSHRLTPSVFEGQRTVDWQVTVSGGTMGGAFRDGAGDLVQGWTVAGPVDEIVVSGIRASLEKSLSIKRDGQGVVGKPISPPRSPFSGRFSVSTSPWSFSIQKTDPYFCGVFFFGSQNAQTKKQCFTLIKITNTSPYKR